MAIDSAVKRGPIRIDSRAANIHPEHWFTDTYEQMPFEEFPLTGFMDRMKGVVSNSYKFHWKEKGFNTHTGFFIAAHRSAGLDDTIGATDATASGSVVYFACDVATANNIVKGMTLVVHDLANMKDLPVRVTDSKPIDATTSYVAAVTRAADTNNVLYQNNTSPTSEFASDLGFTISSNSHPELAGLPKSRWQEKLFRDGYTQQMMESASISWREKNEESRGENDISKEMIRDALKSLMIQREYMRLLQTGGTGPDGTTYSTGLKEFIETYAPDNVCSFKTDTDPDFAGQTFVQGWLKWARKQALRASRFHTTRKRLVLSGDVAANDISEAVLAAGWQPITVNTNKYGIEVRTLIGLGQEWKIIVHPLLATNPRYQRTMVVTDLSLLKTVTRRGGSLIYIPAGRVKENGFTFVTGEMSGWYVDEGLRINNADAHLWIDNVGLDNEN